MLQVAAQATTGLAARLLVADVADDLEEAVHTLLRVYVRGYHARRIGVARPGFPWDPPQALCLVE